MPGGYATDDGVALHFINGNLHNVVSSRAKAQGYKIEMRGDKIEESPLPTKFLGRN
jgi:dipeptidase E